MNGLKIDSERVAVDYAEPQASSGVRRPRPRGFRALSYLAAGLLLFALFAACSSDDVVSADGPAGPPGVSITSVSFYPSSIGAGGSGGTGGEELTCGGPVAVLLNISNWTLKPPGLCQAAPKCGQVRVRLSRTASSNAFATKVAASAAVDVELQGPLAAGRFYIQAELIDDAGNVFANTDAGDAGDGSAPPFFTLDPQTDCAAARAANGAAGAAAASGEGGAGGAHDLGPGGAGGTAAGAGGTAAGVGSTAAGAGGS